MSEDLAAENVEYKIKKIIFASNISTSVVYFTILNLVFNFLRFHDFTGMSFLGKMRLPIFFTIITGITALNLVSSTKPIQLVLFLYFLLFEALRTVVGHIVLPDFVLNDAWQFNTWRDLIMYLFAIVIPISMGFADRRNLNRLITLFTISGFALTLWGITHSGRGPGGHLGDENDLCLVLIFLLPFSLLYSSSKKNYFAKLFGLTSGILLILGIVATQSRGGFLGFVALVFFQFVLSNKKIKWIAVACFVALVSLPFVPKQYYAEINSISTEAKTNSGTIDERLRTWKMVMRMWQDPKNMPFGVGLENSKWNFKNYQEPGSGETIKSLAGRATHSLYFQILGDLGIWGIVFFITCFYICIKQLRQVKREAIECSNNLIKLESRAENRSLITLLHDEVRFVIAFSIALLSSWFGVLAAAVGISVAYYPTLWIMMSVTAALYSYWQKLNNAYLLLNEK